MAAVLKFGLGRLFWIFHKLGYKWWNIKAFYYSCLLENCGDNLKVWGAVSLKNPQKISLGKNVSLNDGVYINGLGGVKVGNDVSISASVVIVSTALKSDCFLERKEHISKKIVVGNNVQIGAGAIVLSGVEIGSNVIVGAGAVVVKSLPSGVIAVGNPAKIMRRVQA